MVSARSGCREVTFSSFALLRRTRPKMRVGCFAMAFVRRPTFAPFSTAGHLEASWKEIQAPLTGDRRAEQIRLSNGSRGVQRNLLSRSFSTCLGLRCPAPRTKGDIFRRARWPQPLRTALEPARLTLSFAPWTRRALWKLRQRRVARLWTGADRWCRFSAKRAPLTDWNMRESYKRKLMEITQILSSYSEGEDLFAALQNEDKDRIEQLFDLGWSVLLEDMATLLLNPDIGLSHRILAQRCVPDRTTIAAVLRELTRTDHAIEEKQAAARILLELRWDLVEDEESGPWLAALFANPALRAYRSLVRHLMPPSAELRNFPAVLEYDLECAIGADRIEDVEQLMDMGACAPPLEVLEMHLADPAGAAIVPRLLLAFNYPHTHLSGVLRGAIAHGRADVVDLLLAPGQGSYPPMTDEIMRLPTKLGDAGLFRRVLKFAAKERAIAGGWKVTQIRALMRGREFPDAFRDYMSLYGIR
ncbi:hypothetical protein DFJ74DRAFT_262491 [Hyaloraphidium curvatum]|nr:hypothetical protein DFJ74DRAFT_262491 [Hyaloraphidium curvatum]